MLACYHRRVPDSDPPEFEVIQWEKLLPTNMSLPVRAPSHTVGVEHGALQANTRPPALASTRPPALASTPWPGPDFKLKQILPGSVYLWACGERGEGDGESPAVSRPEFWAAWVVLIVSAEFLKLGVVGLFQVVAHGSESGRPLSSRSLPGTSK